MPRDSTMPVIGSNQYPRLPWTRNSEPVHGGFVAHPHGEGLGTARVYYHRVNDRGYWRVWTVGWTGRFAKHGLECAATKDAAKQAAADMATLAYWDGIAATEDWIQPPEQPPPPPPPDEVIAWRRKIEDWIASGPTREELWLELNNLTYAADPIGGQHEHALTIARIQRAIGDWRDLG